MQANKLKRVNEDIARELSALLREVKDPRVRQGMMSVVAVETTSDLKHAKVFLSVLGLEDEKGLMKGLESATGYLRRELGRALDLRHTPELNFLLDRSMEHGARVSSVLKSLDVGEGDEQNDTPQD